MTYDFYNIVKEAQQAERIGNFIKSDELMCILESYNRCLVCGSKQLFDDKYYKHTGLWRCPECNKYFNRRLTIFCIIKINEGQVGPRYIKHT